MIQIAGIILTPIKEKGYGVTNVHGGKPIGLIGINFSSEERNIVERLEGRWF